MKTAEEILEMHLGSDLYYIKKMADFKHILAAMEEYASQFKTVEPEKRADLLKEIMDTDQEHGMYEPEKKIICQRLAGCIKFDNGQGYCDICGSPI